MNAKLYASKKDIFLHVFVILISIIYMWALEKNILIEYGLLGLLVGVYFVIPPKKQLEILFCIVPFSAVMKVPGMVFSIFIILQLIVILNLSFIEKIRFSVEFMICWILLAAIQLTLCIFYDGSLMALPAFFSNLLFVYICASYLKDKDDYNDLVIFLITGVIISSSIAFFLNGGKVSFNMNAGRFAGLWTNPNFYAQQILTSLFLLQGLFLEKEINLLKEIILSGLLILFGFLTFSKMFTVVLILMSSYCFILYLYQQKNKLNSALELIKTMITTVIAIGALVAIYQYIVLPVWIRRFAYLGNDIKGITSGRSEIVMVYIDWIKNNIQHVIFGVGRLNSAPFIGAEIQQNEMLYAHNSYLDMIMETGIVGCGLLAAMAQQAFNKMKIMSLFRPRAMFVFVILISSFTVSFGSSDLIFVVLPLYAMANNKRKEEM